MKTRNRRRPVRKIAVVAAVCIMAMAGTVFAGGKIATMYGSSVGGFETTSYDGLEKLSKNTVPGVSLPEEFQNGFRFAGAVTEDVAGADEAGNEVSRWKELNVSYEDGSGRRITINTASAENREALDGEEPAPTEQRGINGVTVSYNYDEYLFLPPDGEPTEAENAREASDDHYYISYGSAERETVFYSFAGFEKDGIHYSIFTSDPVDRELLYDMAEELIEA
ncbi:MAG: DUF4179 domain-containing protein [Eubacterium sp.]|nr:DUF4179 domain-containing protein [Eubacterium sp.]